MRLRVQKSNCLLLAESGVMPWINGGHPQSMAEWPCTSVFTYLRLFIEIVLITAATLSVSGSTVKMTGKQLGVVM